MTKLFKHFKTKEWTLVGFSLAFIVTQVWLDLKLPDYMSAITRLVQTEGSALGDVLSAGGWMLLCALGSLVCSAAVAGLAAQIAATFSARLRSALFDQVQSFSMAEINAFSTASLITRSTNDVTQVQSLIVMGLQVMIKAPILAVWAIVKIAGKSWQWTFSTGMAVLVLVAVVGVCMALAIPKFKKMQQQTDEINRVTRENLNGLRVVRAYNAEGYQEAKFEEANENLTRTNLYTNRVMAWMSPTISLVMSGLSLAIYWIGAVLIQSAAGPAKLTLFSDMVVFSSYAMQVVMAFMMLVMIFIMLPRSLVSARRIQEVLDRDPTVRDGGLTEGKPGLRGEIEFRNVSFQYPGAEEAVLEDISFTAHRGETVAFIGSTGSGKSTLVHLVPRFFDATKGEIRVDGVNVTDYTQEALRRKIGYVSQSAVLFGGTVQSNVAFGEDMEGFHRQSDVVDAVYTAQGADFVENLPGEYQGFVAQGGTNLSGGQKQRLSIARAIYRRPEIFIFDDAFSALDYSTDRRLRAALGKELREATKLIVAQRIGTIQDADRIIVLDEGRIVGNGTHRELLESCPVYQEIVYSQLTKEELA